jgi:hypothetical protein
MKQGEQYNYEIVKINHQTHVYSILEVVRGESLEVSRAERYKNGLTQEERDAGGWPIQACLRLEWGSCENPLVAGSDACNLSPPSSLRCANIPTQAKIGLEWATPPMLPS